MNDPGDETEHNTTCRECGHAMRYERVSPYLDTAWCRAHRLPRCAVIYYEAIHNVNITGTVTF